MKFTKGLLVGGLVTAGLLMMYSESDMMNKNKKKMTKKGIQFAKNMGVI